jgi:hypothetical protein
MASSRSPNSAVHQTHLKQSGSRGKPEVATVSLARGIFGGEPRARIETEGEQSNAGEFPKTLTLCASVHIYNACTWTRTYNSLDLSLNSFSLRPFVLQNSNPYAHISFFLLLLYNARMLKYSIYIYKFIIYIKIWHSSIAREIEIHNS